MMAVMTTPATAALARCSADAACPRRWRTGPDRDCGQHQDSDGDLAAAAAQLGIGLPPGGRGRDDGDGTD